MNVNDFEQELLLAGTHEKVFFRHGLDKELHIINKIEHKCDVVFLEESLNLAYDYEELDCQALAMILDKMEQTEQTKWDDNTIVNFVYTEEDNYTKVVCNEIVFPFTKEGDSVYIDTYNS